MTTDDKTREAIALFRYGLVADLLHREAGQRGALCPAQREGAAGV